MKKKLIVFCFVLFGLISCGQTGALYLPELGEQHGEKQV